MGKRRKRTDKNIPAKGRLRDMADQLWSKAILADWGNKCPVCGSRANLNAHHLAPRHHEATRYDLRNGCCLCSRCHLFDNDISPHLNAAGWLLWLSEHWPGVHAWYTGTVERGEHRAFNGTKNAVYYCEVIRGLREYVESEDFDRIVGIRFSAWLTSEDCALNMPPD